MQWHWVHVQCCTNYHHLWFQNFFFTSEGNLHPLSSHSPFAPPLSPCYYCLRSVFSDLHILNISYKWNHTTYVIFCDWLLPCRIIFSSSSIYIVPYISTSFLFIGEEYSSISFMFAHSSVDRYLRGGQKLYIKCVHQLKNAATSSKH